MNRFAPTISIIALCLAGVCSTSSWADTYRWVDDNGVVNYAERVPRGVPSERVTKVSGPQQSTSSRAASRRNVATPTSAPPVSRPSSGGSGEPLSESQEDMLRDLQQAEADRVAQIAKIRQDNCDRSRRVLDNLTSKERIRVRSETGIERALPEDERQNRIAQAQRGIVENCGA